MKQDPRKIELARCYLGWSKTELRRRLGIPASDRSLEHALPVLNARPRGLAWGKVHLVLGGLPLDWCSDGDERQRLFDAGAPTDHRHAEQIMLEICPTLLDCVHGRVYR